jgi:ATP-dependent Clp protease protease subunit
MGSVLLTGGAAGKRYALPHSKILIHQPWVSQIGGQATDVEIAARDLIATRQTIAKIYEKTTQKPLEQILKDIDRDYYMTSQEAKDYGIIDQIIEDRQALSTPA